MEELMSFINNLSGWKISQSKQKNLYGLTCYSYKHYTHLDKPFTFKIKAKNNEEFLKELEVIINEFDITTEAYSRLDDKGYGPGLRSMKSIYEEMECVSLSLEKLIPDIRCFLEQDNSFINHAMSLDWKVDYRDKGFLLSTFVQPHDQFFQIYFDGDIESQIERLISTQQEVILTREEIIGKLVELSPASKLNNNKHTLDNIMNAIHDMGCETDIIHFSSDSLYAIDIWIRIDNEPRLIRFKFKDAEAFFVELKKVAQNSKELSFQFLHFYYKLIKKLGGY